MPSKIKPEFVPVYAAADSLDDAWELINANLPITTTNDLKGLVMIYHNSCVRAVEERIANETDTTTLSSIPIRMF